MIQLKGKIIVITGASSGLGEKIAYKAAEKGATPILLARRKDKLIQTVEIINEKTDQNAYWYELDVSNLEKVKEVFNIINKKFTRIDILVNNAGYGVFDTFYEASLDEIKGMFDVNVLGLMACTKEVLPSMLGQNRGHIINIASQAGKLATPKSSAYSATKHAVLGFTNSLRMELVNTNISVSAVNPGPIETNFFNIADKSGNYAKNVKKFMLDSDNVAEKIIDLMIHPKRELNLPRWMSVGSTLYNLFPSFSERLTGKFLNKK